MGQIITNTFFDDCEGIVNENGRPVWKFNFSLYNVWPRETLRERLKRLGLSERVGEDLSVLAGVLSCIDYDQLDYVERHYAAVRVNYTVTSTDSEAYALQVAAEEPILEIRADYYGTPKNERLDLICE